MCHHSPPHCEETSSAQPGKNTPPWNCQFCHIGCICVLPDAPLEQPDPRVLRSKILTLTETTKGLHKSVPNNKTLEIYTSKSSPSHIQADKHTYEHSHRPTDRRRIFLGMRSSEYSTTPKGEDKLTRILQKEGIRFYRRRRGLSHDIGILHLTNKVSPTFRTKKNGVKNATVTQWRTATTLCLVIIWAEIIIRLDSYSGTTCDTPVNTVWVELQKQQSFLA